MDGGGLQLLPGTKKRLGIKVPGENRFLYIGSAILGATLVLMFALDRYQTSLMNQVDKLNTEIQSLEDKRNKRDEADLRLAKDRLAVTADLIVNHAYMTQLFSWLEDILQSDIQITDFGYKSDGKISIIGVASGYTVVARQIASFLADSKVLDIGVGELKSKSDGTVEFTLTLTLELDKIIKR